MTSPLDSTETDRLQHRTPHSSFCHRRWECGWWVKRVVFLVSLIGRYSTAYGFREAKIHLDEFVQMAQYSTRDLCIAAATWCAGMWVFWYRVRTMWVPPSVIFQECNRTLDYAIFCVASDSWKTMVAAGTAIPLITICVALIVVYRIYGFVMLLYGTDHIAATENNVV